ncbi:hypothetical protein P6709_15420 [Jeotgalibacillus sp. ET6]|uniref:hypothetical protein n=1 Tax=Jeotgalibacillus sp. ET6 TaxID=3037260 RepID=UPI002418B57D|nr:hypothetical protein [Jeotgalibacillus sp. ET6]MDG5473142.1 hypothetical protein [Jeotgalibacillus sp. ET6]
MRKNIHINRDAEAEQANKLKLEETIKRIEEKMEQTTDPKSHQQMLDVLTELKQVQQANCLEILFDQCTIEFPAGSVQTGIVQPPFIVNVLNDPFFLNCCITPVQVSACTPCGVVGGVTVNEVKAVGYINYYFNLEFSTFFNDGEGNCAVVNQLPFSCTGTTCADNVICYASVEDSDPCPDFCNFGVQSVGVLVAASRAGNKATFTFDILHLLPDCNSQSE